MERGVLTTLYKVCAINNEEMRIIGNCYQSYQIPNYLILNEAYVYKFFDHLAQTLLKPFERAFH